MVFLSEVHRFLSTATTLFTLLITLYAGFHFVRRLEFGGDFWGAVAIGEGLIALQAVAGLILLGTGSVPARDVHFLYGAMTVLIWPSVFAFTQGRTGRRETMFWILTSAALFGIALRARATGWIP